MFAVALMLPLAAHAASGDSVPFEASIRGPDSMVVGHTVIYTASSNKVNSGTVTYTWFQRGLKKPISTSSEAFFLPPSPGEYLIRLIVQSQRDGEIREAMATETIRVYQRKVVLIADGSMSDADIQTLSDQAQKLGVFLSVIRPSTSTVPLIGQTSFTETINNDFDQLTDADSVIVRTNPPLLGIQALARAAGDDQNRLTVFHTQSIIVVTDESLPTIARTMRGPTAVLNPMRMFLSRPDAMSLVLQSKDMQDFEQSAVQQRVEFLLQTPSVEPLRPWNALSVLVNYMLRHGIPSQTVLLLLMLPIIATLLTFLKQVVGMSTFGLYTPSIIALSFLSLGWGLGLLFLLCIVGASYIARSIMRSWRMLHTPKIAIILAFVSLVLLVLIAIGAGFNIVLSADSIFILLIMSTLSESLMTTKIEEGWRSALSGIVETIVASLLCVFIVNWATFQTLILAYPELILLTFVIDILLGRYTGLRITEYLRFRELFKHLQEE